MSVLCFGSLGEIQDADLPKLGPTVWSSKKGAYLYAALSSKWRAKIGAATYPAGRIIPILTHWGDVQQIFVTPPRKDWRETELELVKILEDYQTVGLMCSYGSKEWFKLPKEVYASLRQCFINGVTKDALHDLRVSTNKPNQHAMKTVIGICSLCGGQVIVPHVWAGVKPPLPTCDLCHAVLGSSNSDVGHWHQWRSGAGDGWAPVVCVLYPDWNAQYAV